MILATLHRDNAVQRRQNEFGPMTPPLPDGLVAVVKRDCPTCQLVAPVLAELADGDVPLTVYSQDDPTFPDAVKVIDDTDARGVVRTRYRDGPDAVARRRRRDRRPHRGLAAVGVGGAHRPRGLGAGLPEYRPGCGSRTHDPDIADARADAAGATRLRSRRIELGDSEDDVEAVFERGWSDGLPVVPPTPERVARMLTGTARDADEVVAVVPPDLVECTVEKVAINAVMAGCRPEYLPVVLAAVEAACTDEFNMHGLLATTWFSGPVVIVNGPIARAIGMNSGVNALGQGNRANATIGRALQLVIRNVGGGRPGGVDRATLGNPGKYTFCFAEDEAGSPWEPLHVERGLAPDASAVTLFAGDGVRGDRRSAQRGRRSRWRARSPPACARSPHPKLVFGFDAVLVVSPEHAPRLPRGGLVEGPAARRARGAPPTPGRAVVRGAGGIAEGLPEALAGADRAEVPPTAGC